MDTLSFLDSKTLLLVIAAIRRSFNINSMELQIALNRGLSSKVGPKGGSRYFCAHCSQIFARNKIFVDHIIPIVPVESNQAEMSLRMFYERCFCIADNLQLLCDHCHKSKTAIESSKRKEFRKLKKLQYNDNIISAVKLNILK